ncbi:MAG: tetratricopeptide repeat protein [Verrucomicrobia bacterium]|nr:tetratricopeptide repeat protein [Verrucomicrobiota bacterium]
MLKMKDVQTRVDSLHGSKSYARVFLSSTARDLRECRDAAYQAFQGIDGFHCVRMEDFGARDWEADEFCRRQVSECDLFVGIVGHLYGSCPHGSEESFTEREYNAAVASNIPRLMFLAPDAFPVPADLIEPEKNRLKQQAFRDRVRRERIAPATFSSPADLRAEVAKAIANWKSERQETKRLAASETTNTMHGTVLGETTERPTSFRDVPPPPDVLVGRDEILAALRDRLRQGGVTILKGEGGIGKTALALTAVYGAHKAGDLPGGVGWVDCSSSTDFSECLRVICAGFFGDRMEAEPPERLQERVVTRLREYAALVVLDNFESVANDTNLLQWVASVRVPMRVLITTRLVPDGLHGEVLKLDELKPADAIDLFVKRATGKGLKSVDRNLAVTLCSAVGNHPLAIELLAPRAARMPLPRLLERVLKSIRDIAANDPTRPERHRSLLACLKLSYQRLRHAARHLLLRLSVLPDGAGDEVIQAVTGRSDWDKPAAELVNASLWRFDGTRYSLHTLVRQFALAQLAPKKRTEAELHAVRSLLNLVRSKGQMSKRGAGPPDEAKAALNWFAAEWRNIVTCAELAFDARDWKAVGELADAIVEFSLVRGHWADCERLYRGALAARSNALDRNGEARTLRNLGVFYRYQQRWSDAQTVLEDSRTIYHGLNDRLNEAEAMKYLGRVHEHQGRLAEAENLLRDCFPILREFGDRVSEGQALDYLGGVLEHQGRSTEAEEHYKRSLTLRRQTRDWIGEAQTLHNLGLFCQRQNDWRQAEQCHKESLEICRKFGDHTDEANNATNLAIICETEGRWDEAEPWYHQALATRREIGDRRGEADVLARVGGFYARQTKWAEAENAYRASLAIKREMCELDGEAATLVTLASLYTNQGNQGKAKATYEEAENAYQKSLSLQRGSGNRKGVASAFFLLGLFYAMRNDHPKAEQALQEGLKIFEAIADRSAQAALLVSLAGIYHSTGQWAAAKDTYEKSLAICREISDQPREAGVLYTLANTSQSMGKWSDAEERYRQSLAIHSRLGNRAEQHTILNALGILYRRCERWTDAEKCYQDSLSLARACGDRLNEARVLNNLGTLYSYDGRYEEAEAILNESLKMKREVRDRLGEAYTLDSLGEVFQFQGKYAEAEKAYAEALTICSQFDDRFAEGAIRGHLGGLLSILGRFNEANKELRTARGLSPGDYSIVLEVGINCWRAGRHEEAVSQFRLARDNGVDALQTILFECIYLMRTRREDAIPQVVAQTAERHRKIPDQAATVRWMAGKISEEELMTYATTKSSKCGILYWVAEKALAYGDTEHGYRLIAESLTTGATSTYEYRHAVALKNAEKL